MASQIKALERVRPGRRFTLPASSTNVPQPGDVIAFPVVAATESGLQTFRWTPPAQAGSGPLEQFISVKMAGAAGATVNVAFGDASLPATTAANQLLEASDSFQDFQLNVGDVCFRTLGHATIPGTLYILFSGR
jgi:hypothetical protein